MMLDKARDASRENASLARARASENEHGSFEVENRFALRGIEAGQRLGALGYGDVCRF